MRTAFTTALAALVGGTMLLGGPGSTAHAQCPQINIGTPENPRFVRDPACGNPTTSAVNAEAERRRRAREEFAERRRQEAGERRADQSRNR